jgi:hypothetical protein
MVDFDEFITALEQEMADGKNIDFSDVRLLIAKIAKLKVKPKIVVEQWINVIQYNDGRTATDAFNREIDAQSQDYPVKVLARAVPFRWEGEG